MTFLLAGVERRVLQALADRVPRTIRSNHLTAIGILGAAGAGGAYALTRSAARNGPSTAITSIMSSTRSRPPSSDSVSACRRT